MKKKGTKRIKPSRPAGACARVSRNGKFKSNLRHNTIPAKPKQVARA
jgi:hypothetical protein